MSPNVATSQNAVDAAVAEHDLPAVGQGEQLVQAGAHRAARPALHRRLAVATCRGSVWPAAASASTASGRTLDGPQPKRPSAGRSDRRGSKCARSGPTTVTVSAWQPWTRISTTHRRDRRVGHAGRRRQGQGAEGRGRGRHRLRRRRARLPDAGRTSSRPPSPPAATRKNHRYTPAGGLPELREAIAAKTKRDSGFDVRGGQVLVTNGGKHAVYNTFADAARPGRRGARCRRRTGRPTPRRSRSPAACRSWSPTDEATGFRVTVEQLEAARTPRTKALLFVSPRNPTGAVYPPDEVEAIGRWAVEHGHLGRHRRDLRAPHLRRPRVLVDADARARARRPVRRRQRRGQDLRHDRLAGRLDDRPARRHQGRDQPAVATATSNVANVVAARPRWPRCSGDLDGGRR